MNQGGMPTWIQSQVGRTADLSFFCLLTFDQFLNVVSALLGLDLILPCHCLGPSLKLFCIDHIPWTSAFRGTNRTFVVELNTVGEVFSVAYIILAVGSAP
jgi:hypothetical protein